MPGQNDKPTFFAALCRECLLLWPAFLVLLWGVVVPALVVIGILKAIGVK